MPWTVHPGIQGKKQNWNRPSGHEEISGTSKAGSKKSRFEKKAFKLKLGLQMFLKCFMMQPSMWDIHNWPEIGLADFWSIMNGQLWKQPVQLSYLHRKFCDLPFAVMTTPSRHRRKTRTSVSFALLIHVLFPAELKVPAGSTAGT